MTEKTITPDEPLVALGEAAPEEDTAPEVVSSILEELEAENEALKNRVHELLARIAILSRNA